MYRTLIQTLPNTFKRAKRVEWPTGHEWMSADRHESRYFLAIELIIKLIIFLVMVVMCELNTTNQRIRIDNICLDPKCRTTT